MRLRRVENIGARFEIVSFPEYFWIRFLSIASSLSVSLDTWIGSGFNCCEFISLVATYATPTCSQPVDQTYR
jgi:hypothetical protein